MKISNFNIECRKCRSMDCELTNEGDYLLIKCYQCNNEETILLDS